jgi:hypothetical protein
MRGESSSIAIEAVASASSELRAINVYETTALFGVLCASVRAKGCETRETWFLRGVFRFRKLAENGKNFSEGKFQHVCSSVNKV